jgi:hypothetical protein
MFGMKGAPFQSQSIASHKTKHTKTDVVWNTNDVRLSLMPDKYLQHSIISFWLLLFHICRCFNDQVCGIKGKIAILIGISI